MTETAESTSSLAALDPAALAELRRGFGGQLLEPHDPEYDSARRAFNGMFDQRPAVILRPSGTADVMSAIGFARLGGLPLAIRGCGHSVAGFSGCEGGVVTDMRAMNAISVEPSRRTVRAQAGIDWRAFDRETQWFTAAAGGSSACTGWLSPTSSTTAGCSGGWRRSPR